MSKENICILARIPPHFAEAFRATQRDVEKQFGGKIDLEDPENMHITLVYLQGVDSKLKPVISDKVQEIVGKVGPFALQPRGLGTFAVSPNSGGRIPIYIDYVDHTQLAALYHKLTDGLQEYFPEDVQQFSRYDPHSTLGYFTGTREDAELALAPYQNIVYPTWTLSHVDVNDSTQEPYVTHRLGAQPSTREIAAKTQSFPILAQLASPGHWVGLYQSYRIAAHRWQTAPSPYSQTELGHALRCLKFHEMVAANGQSTTNIRDYSVLAQKYDPARPARLASDLQQAAEAVQQGWVILAYASGSDKLLVQTLDARSATKSIYGHPVAVLDLDTPNVTQPKSQLVQEWITRVNWKDSHRRIRMAETLRYDRQKQQDGETPEEQTEDWPNPHMRDKTIRAPQTPKHVMIDVEPQRLYTTAAITSTKSAKSPGVRSGASLIQAIRSRPNPGDYKNRGFLPRPDWSSFRGTQLANNPGAENEVISQDEEDDRDATLRYKKPFDRQDPVEDVIFSESKEASFRTAAAKAKFREERDQLARTPPEIILAYPIFAAKPAVNPHLEDGSPEVARKKNRADPFPQAFRKKMRAKGKTFRSPRTGNKVLFDSLPWPEQVKFYKRWKTSHHGQAAQHSAKGKIPPTQQTDKPEPKTHPTEIQPEEKGHFGQAAEHMGLDDEGRQALQSHVEQQDPEKVHSATQQYPKDHKKFGRLYAVFNFMRNLGALAVHGVKHWAQEAVHKLRAVAEGRHDYVGKMEKKERDSQRKAYVYKEACAVLLASISSCDNGDDPADICAIDTDPEPEEYSATSSFDGESRKVKRRRMLTPRDGDHEQEGTGSRWVRSKHSPLATAVVQALVTEV